MRESWQQLFGDGVGDISRRELVITTSAKRLDVTIGFVSPMDALIEQLKRYGRHTPLCDVVQGSHPPPPSPALHATALCLTTCTLLSRTWEFGDFEYVEPVGGVIGSWKEARRYEQVYTAFRAAYPDSRRHILGTLCFWGDGIAVTQRRSVHPVLQMLMNMPWTERYKEENKVRGFAGPAWNGFRWAIRAGPAVHCDAAHRQFCSFHPTRSWFG